MQAIVFTARQQLCPRLHTGADRCSVNVLFTSHTRSRGARGARQSTCRNSTPDYNQQTPQRIRAIGNNEGCMLLKGASKRHEGQEPRADEWPMREDLLSLAVRWGVGTGW